MARAHINFRTWIALIVLGALVALFACLGNWQLDRGAQRDAIHAQIQHAAQLPTVTLTPNISEADLVPWRHAQTQGHWLHQYTVLLQNRNYQGQPGYWVATPLQIEASPADANSDTAVLVLRGWLARDSVTQHNDSGAAELNPALGHELARSEGHQINTVEGELMSHVPRLFELWSWSSSGHAQLPDRLVDTRDKLPRVQNLDLVDYAQATGLNLLPIVLAADGSVPPMVQDWPHPSSDADTNRGYALQWFSFCLIAAGAWLFIAWRTARRLFS